MLTSNLATQQKKLCNGGVCASQLFLLEYHSSAFLNTKAEFGWDATVRNILSIVSWMMLLCEALNTNSKSWIYKIFWGLWVWAQSKYYSEAYGFSLQSTCEQLEVINTNRVYAINTGTDNRFAVVLHKWKLLFLQVLLSFSFSHPTYQLLAMNSCTTGNFIPYGKSNSSNSSEIYGNVQKSFSTLLINGIQFVWAVEISILVCVFSRTKSCLSTFASSLRLILISWEGGHKISKVTQRHF